MFSNSLKEIIENLLHVRPAYRDDDRRLTASVWAKVVRKQLGLDINKISGFEFLTLYSQGELPHAESIRRTRQKLQENHPNLRGSKYEERQQELEPEMRQKVRAWK